MAREVKRAYDTSGRRARSDETRQRIIDAGHELILERGYRGTTIAAVAARAGVNTDTIYELVGRKPLLLRELIEQAISGTNRTVAADDRDYVRSIEAEPDPARKLAIYARAVRIIQERMAPLYLALSDAASTDPEASEIWDDIGRRRAANMRRLARTLRDAGGLRTELTINEAADVLWATNGSEFFVLLTVERGWSPDRFERWLADTWRRLLLE